MKTRIKIKGFTLVELIIVISLMGIMVAVVGAFMSRPFEVYDAQSRRSNLVTIVTSALVNMKRNVSQAVPNSIRVTPTSLELMQIVSGGRYRHTDTVNQNNGLIPYQLDTTFNTLGNINVPIGGLNFARIIVNPIDTTRLYAAATATAWPNNSNLQAGFITPLQGVGIQTINHTVGTGANPEDTIVMPVAPYRFVPIGTGSARKRFYISDMPIMYVCDLGTQTLTRYSDYTPTIAGTVPTGSVTSNLVMNNLSFCNITLAPGSATRISYVTITLGAAIDGEEIRIVQQLQVSNSP